MVDVLLLHSCSVLQGILTMRHWSWQKMSSLWIQRSQPSGAIGEKSWRRKRSHCKCCRWQFISVIMPLQKVCSILPSIHKVCRPNKPSVQNFLWCVNREIPKAMMWPQPPPKVCPTVMPWILLGENTGLYIISTMVTHGLKTHGCNREIAGTCM